MDRMIERHWSGACTLAVALLSGFGAPAPRSRTGTWERGSFEKGGGVLVVVDDADGTRFQLQLSRGGEVNNLGFLEGRLTVTDGLATHVRRSEGSHCEITFRFERETVVLKQTVGSSGECEFGHGVDAGGTYRRTSRKKPTFDLSPED
jgi:hypothetical protein